MQDYCKNFSNRNFDVFKRLFFVEDLLIEQGTHHENLNPRYGLVLP